MFWFILLVPLIFAAVVKVVFHASITWKEMGLQVVGSTVITAIVLACGLYSQTADVEIWNGYVVDKKQVRVSCEHSYSCNCRTVTSGSGKNQTSYTVCDTCYEHSHDHDWRVYASFDDYRNIHRVDRQGENEPPRWTAAYVGEPYSAEKMYTNYIKAVPESIFGRYDRENDPYAAFVAQYPQVYDYYRVTRVQVTGVPIPDHKDWNDGLNEVAKRLGSSKEVNPIIQFVKTDDPKYKFTLENQWLNGKKNDVIVVFGVNTYPKIDFVTVVGWENEELKIKLTNDLQKYTVMDNEFRTVALALIEDNITKYHKRMNMADYEYLKDQIEPPTWVVILGFVLAILSSAGFTYWFHREDIFGDEHRGYYR